MATSQNLVPLKVLLPPQEAAEIREAADRDYCSVSTWMRQVLLRELSREPRQKGA